MRRFEDLLKTCLALVLCMAILAGCAAKPPAEPAPAPEAEAEAETVTDVTEEDWNKIVAQFGNHTLTCAGFSYFYWASFTSFLNYHGSDAKNYLDLYTPLNEQMYSEELTWEDYFINDALMAYKQYCTLNDLAEAEGFELSEEAQKTLEDLPDELLKTAQAMGFETVEEYLQANYGGGATLENYTDYLEHHFVVQEYTAALQKSFTFTDEEVEKYYDDHAEEYAENGVTKEDVKMAKLRYLMILPADQTEESYESIDTAFNEMLEDWEMWEDKSEEGFMAFGEKWSEKGFAQDYLDAVAPGTVYFSFFDDWVFREPRKAGDTRTWVMQSGDYLFYYIGQRDEVFWRSQARYDMCRDAFTTFLLQEMTNYSYTLHEENIIISQAADLYSDPIMEEEGTILDSEEDAG